MEYYYQPCKEHSLRARYCPEERRWICENCEPEKRGIFIEINGVKVIWGDEN